MPKPSPFHKLLQQIQVVAPPKHRLATFGSSKIEYTLVTNVPGLPDRTKLRLGHVTAEKPMIITRETLKDRFVGFGDKAVELADRMVGYYGEALRGLEYQFHNELSSTRIELATPDRVMKSLLNEHEKEGGYRKALISGNEKYWELSIMKFIIEETLASFNANLQELNERGFFDGEKRVIENQHREIRFLFKKGAQDKSVIGDLARKLKEYNLFEHYQDEFFKLVK